MTYTELFVNLLSLIILGDFAVLISSGLSLKQALILNLLSSLTAFAGGIVGIVLGTHWAASPWIFALTGGLFIYISLVDMVGFILLCYFQENGRNGGNA